MIRAAALRLHSAVSAGSARSLVVNASSMIGTVAVSSVLGVVYWWLAARSFSPTAVGAAAAGISAMLLLGNMAVLGLGYLLIAELPRSPGREAALIATALTVVFGVGGLVGGGLALVAPYFLPDVVHLGSGALAAGLIVGVGVTAVGRVLDQAVLGMLQGVMQLWRNVAFAVAKLVALLVVALWFGDDLGLLIFLTWVVGELISLGGLAALAVWQGGSVRAFRPDWTLLRGWGGPALGHHGINLALQTPAYALPLLVTALVSVTANSYFYAAWLIANFVFVGPFALTTALFAAGARAPAELAQRTRLTLSLSMAGGLVAAIVLILAADVILYLFNPAYAEQAATPLRVLALGVFPLIVKEHYVAICRVQAHAGNTVMVLAASGALELSLAAVGALAGGLVGLSLGWLLALTIEAVLMAGRVYRTIAPAELSASPAGRDASPALHMPDLSRPVAPPLPAGSVGRRT